MEPPQVVLPKAHERKKQIPVDVLAEGPAPTVIASTGYSPAVVHMPAA